jgi:GDP-4-dehydro-6-deoxy-D-mannose reductase
MNKHILVTGANGFVGHHVVRELHQLGIDVIALGTDEQPSEQNAPYISRYIACNMLDAEAVQAIRFDDISGVIHLAGLANVGQSFDQPAEFIAANTGMTINLLHHALTQKSDARFVVVSSGAVYESSQPLPISEAGILTHSSPYAVSKLAVEMMGDYFRGRGLHVVNVRPFNHIGPGQGKGFIVPDMLVKLIDYRDNGTPLKTGNIDTARDYTDVRDVANAYISIVTHDSLPQHDVYNVCSGKSRTGREIITALASALQLPTMPEADVDPALVRPSDAKDIFGDNSRLSHEFGWTPQYSFDQTIQDIVAGTATK